MWLIKAAEMLQKYLIQKVCRVNIVCHKLWINELCSDHKKLGKGSKMSPSKVEMRMKPLAQGNRNHSMDQVNRSYSQGPEGAIGQHKKLCY